MIAGLLYPNLYKLETHVLLLRLLCTLPGLINIVCLAESYIRKNFKIIPWMLQMIMLRKELQLLFDIDHGENSAMAKTMLISSVSIMVTAQVILGTFTS